MKHMNNKLNIPELLSPAGSYEGLKAVISAGADAVYIGGDRFGARAYADNPSGDMLLDAIRYAHLRDVKVYLTVNTLLKDRELDELYDWLLPYYREGVDAVLVQDFGVLKYLKEHFPDLPLHASTQMNITGPDSARLLALYGVTRIVPARELSLRELVLMKERSGLEIETFIHGALCCCYSGQCLYSSLIGGRSGNRGRCAQPCRLLYLLDNDDFDGSRSIVERKDARHYLSPKDLCGIDLLPELALSGISSLKIEGRMKKSEYAAGVTSVYRKYLDLLKAEGPDIRTDPEDRQMLYDLYNRSGFTEGYYHQHNGPSMMAYIKHELTPGETDVRHALYKKMHELYIDHEKKVPLEIDAEVYAGSPVFAEFRSGKHVVSTTGAVAEKARNQALGSERITEQLKKTGDSDYEAVRVTVNTDECSFLPVKELNHLRRNGLDALSRSVLDDFRRHAEVPPSVSKTDEEPGLRTVRNLMLSVLVSEEEQLEEAVRCPEAGRIYLESSMLYRMGDPAAAVIRLLRRIKDAGKEAWIALPYVTRDGWRAGRIEEEAGALHDAGLSGFLVRNPESLSYFALRGMQELVRTDAGLYDFNREADAFFREIGTAGDTAPFELNRKELFRRDNSRSELTVYGYIPLMVTVQCLKKNTSGCTKKNESYSLTDRMGVKFPVKCDCVFCYNVVRNSVPLFLLGEMDTIRKMGFPGIRLEFTIESAGETARILKQAAAALRGDPVRPDILVTKGHFLRGVE